MINIFDNWIDNSQYFRMLNLMGQLSNLFSESKIPYLHYRVAENLFCKYFNAINMSRSDIAFDAILDDYGIGIKTFQLKNKNYSIEKVAEFNALSATLRDLRGKHLAQMVAKYRNERILLAEELCNTNKRRYHLIGRREGELIVFNNNYDIIDVDNIADVKQNKMISVNFNDGKNEYTYNYSKSVLLKKFKIPLESYAIPVKIIDDPYELIESLLSSTADLISATKEYVILPLYSVRQNKVPVSSGLNQWNAQGRKRDYDEVYISIPKEVHRNHQDFFPDRDSPFNLHLPNGSMISAKLCQVGAKALMSNPNKALGKWILRDIMKMPMGQLVTMEDLHRLGFDSLMVTKVDTHNFELSVSYTQRYK